MSSTETLPQLPIGLTDTQASAYFQPTLSASLRPVDHQRHGVLRPSFTLLPAVQEAQYQSQSPFAPHAVLLINRFSVTRRKTPAGNVSEPTSHAQVTTTRKALPSETRPQKSSEKPLTWNGLPASLFPSKTEPNKSSFLVTCSVIPLP
jgi:hypothetical protein